MGALFTDLSEAALAVPVVFLVGGIVLNVLKEKLPEERQSRFSAFLPGSRRLCRCLLAV